MSITVHGNDIEGLMKAFAEHRERQWVGQDGRTNCLALSVGDMMQFLHFYYDPFIASAKSAKTDADTQGTV